MSDKLSKDQRRVLGVIRRMPGASGGAIEWAMIGGEFKNGLPVATNIGVLSPELFAKAKKGGSRASELSQQVVRRVGARFSLTGDSSEIGYWPVSSGGARAVPVPGGERVEVVSRGVAKSEGSVVLDASAVGAGVAELSGWLED